MATSKFPTSLRLSDEARAMQAALARRLGVSLTAVVEMAVRKLYASEIGVPVTSLRLEERSPKKPKE